MARMARPLPRGEVRATPIERRQVRIRDYRDARRLSRAVAAASLRLSSAFSVDTDTNDEEWRKQQRAILFMRAELLYQFFSAIALCRFADSIIDGQPATLLVATTLSLFGVKMMSAMAFLHTAIRCCLMRGSLR